MSTLKPKVTERINGTGTISWCVDAGYCNGKRHRRFFPTKAEATSYADQLHIARRNQGLAVFSLNDEQRLQAKQAFDLLATIGAALPDAVAFYLKHAQPKGGKRTVTQVAAELVESKRKKGFKPRYVKALRVAFAVFRRKFGERLLDTIDTHEIDQWLDVQNYSNCTKINYLRDLGILFRFAMQRGYCAHNVVKDIERPMADDVPPAILDVEGTTRLLVAAQTQAQYELLPGLAIGFFAGLRSCELEKLDWEEIHLSEDLIEIKAEKSKTRKRRLVDISSNLKAWLQLYARSSGAVLPTNWRRRLQALLPQAEIKAWPKNCARHSFASYHLAEHKSAALTALQLGHADTNMLFSHYRELVRPADAKRYWNIMPAERSNIVELSLVA